MAGVAVDGIVEGTPEGTPQGGPLSPLLANVLPNELDWELGRRGHAFARYADDLVVTKRSRKAAGRAMEPVTRHAESRLFLRVSRDKSFVAHISRDVRYLGHAFYGNGGELRFCVRPKSLASLRDKVREMLSRSNGWSLDWRRHRLRRLVYGWVGYFRLADMRGLLRRVDEWVRRKIRCVYWKCWKRVRTKSRALMRLDINREQAWMWANSRKAYTGAWQEAASSTVRSTTLSSKSLAGPSSTRVTLSYSVESGNRRVPNGTHGGVGGRRAD